ncbi:hypothetical protein NDU88_010728 [Pleurodeles waltl]|uniref:Uncharacterized protein n=1 Tax=Pleurodeles waltl TaxID=8319 RepID=A0AAV7PZL0_PLEWA|nr:hypothetical protein NDU88_010728 [Pleurodeles waltl]
MKPAGASLPQGLATDGERRPSSSPTRLCTLDHVTWALRDLCFTETGRLSMPWPVERASEMQRSRTLCDTLIVVGNQEFHAHSLVLGCSSRKFQSLLQGAGKHCSLDFLSDRTFQQILDFSYSEDLSVNPEDLRCLLTAAELLQMDALEQECLKMLGKLSPQRHENVVDLPRSINNDTIITTKIDAETACCSRLITSVPKSMPCSESFIPSSHRISPSENSMPPSMVSGHPPSIPYKMRQSPEGTQHYDTIEVTLKRVGRQPHKEISGETGEMRSPSLLSGTCTAMECARRTSISSKGGMKLRDTVITTNPCLTPPQQGEVSWSADNLWKSQEGTTTSKSSQPFQPHSAYWSYQLQAFPLLPFSMANPDRMSFSTAMGFPGYMCPFPQDLLHSQHSSRQSTLANINEASSSTVAPITHSREEKKLLSPDAVYRCKICEKHFINDLCLRTHLFSHTGYQPQPCTQCDDLFNSSEERRTHHQQQTEGEVSSSSSTLCLPCGKRCSSQRALREHVLMHSGGWSCWCSECKQAFSSPATLRRHLRIHTGEKKIECEFCSRYFRDENTLRNHKRVHTGEKVYECESCGKKFSLKHQLETHMRVHTGEKPFECNLCHQRSRDYSAMIKHLRTHNGAAPYRCTICLEFCTSLSGMQKHMRGHRAEEIPANWSIEKTYLYSCNT